MVKLQAIRDNGKFLEKMASDSEESEFSGVKNFADLGNCNVASIPKREQIDLERQFREVIGDSNDDSDFEGFDTKFQSSKDWKK